VAVPHADERLAQLIGAIDRAYDRRSWHGTNLRGSIRGLDAHAAARRPAPQRHNIREIVVHAAYWKYAVRRRLLGEPRGSFPLRGSDWFVRPASGIDSAGWRADLELLDDMHRRLREAVERFPPAALQEVPRGSAFSHADLIAGIAAHDLYHAGQIQLIKRMHSRR
jgi:hypothetical protein